MHDDESEIEPAHRWGAGARLAGFSRKGAKQRVDLRHVAAHSVHGRYKCPIEHRPQMRTERIVRDDPPYEVLADKN